jgi:VWFA-related protein
MRAILAAAFAVFFVCVSLAAQSAQPVFHSGVDVVRFDVRVADSAGRPITDLRPEEMQIVENGQPLPILLFQHISEPPGRYTDAALRSVSAEVSSNRESPRGHLYLIVFDQAHITPGNEQLARRAAETFIRERVRPSDRVAVAGIPGPGPALSFTADRARAIAELSKVRGTLERRVTTALGDLSLQEAYEIAAGNDRVLTDVLTRPAVDTPIDIGGGDSTQTSRLADRRAGRTEDPAAVRRAIQENARTLVAQTDTTSRDFIQRLADLIEQYRTIEGRKIVVLFSEGFHQRNLSRELEQLEAAAADTYSVFYAFDLNRRSDVLEADAPGTDPGTELQARLEPLGSLASETDGMLLPDASGHLGSALDRIANQAQDYYLVGFVPSVAAAAARGQYRRVSVRVTRPGAHVSARTGYTVPKASSALDRRGAIDAALAAPFTQQALRVDYTTYVLRSETPARAKVILSLDADLPVRDAAHQFADVVFVVRDAHDGRVAASGTDTMPLPRSAAQGSALGTSGFRVQFELPPGSYLMRAVVREPGGLLGSADRRLNVRPLAGPDATVSDLILGSVDGSLPVRAQAYTDEGLTGLFDIYGRAADQLRTVTATASLVPADAERPAQVVRADVGDLVDGRTGVMRRATFAMPLTRVAPGFYTARVKVTSGADTIAELSREVDIAAGAAPPAQAASADPLFQPSDILGGDFVRAARARLAQASSPAAIHATKGFHFFAETDYAHAAIELTEALKTDGPEAAVAFVLGWAHEGRGEHREAISAWRAAAAIDPTMVPAHLALADAYLRLSQPALAAQALRAGLAALPDSPELQAKLAEVERRH